MKFTVTFKSPDAVQQTIDEIVDEEMDNVCLVPEAKDWELDRFREQIQDQLHSVVSKYVKHEELIVVEFDTRTGTARVLEV